MENHFRPDYPQVVNKWSVFEFSCEGPQEGNPFLEQSIAATFHSSSETACVEGFYDGNGKYRIRFMPSFQEEYQFNITCSFDAEEFIGRFNVTAPARENHGKVHVCNTWHFAYDDGTPYYSIGTTCYAWALQTDALVAQTLESFKKSAFNKVRFCVFPKHYVYNLHEPYSYPFEGTPMDSSVLTKENFGQYDEHSAGNRWDFSRFQPEHFRRLEYCIAELQKLGIEADLILMHPYDRWGFSCMTREQDLNFIRYVAARFAAYSNVWWSLANEYDLMRNKTIEDWEAIAATLCKNDPYHHLRSIHNCMHFYDYSRAWITHCSIQRIDLYKSAELTDQWRELYRKPVVLDEIAYEGDIPLGWGNLTGEEMLRRFWEGALRGGYPGHGETFIGHEEILWWSHGGMLYGESHKRFSLLLDTLKQTPGVGLRLSPEHEWDEVCAVPEEHRFGGTYYLHYYSFMRPSSREYHLEENVQYEVSVIDTWNMTVEHRGVFSGRFRIELPAKQYMAVQIRRIEV